MSIKHTIKEVTVTDRNGAHLEDIHLEVATHEDGDKTVNITVGTGDRNGEGGDICLIPLKELLFILKPYEYEDLL